MTKDSYSKRFPLVIAFAYALLGIVWIFTSDFVLLKLAESPLQVKVGSIAKGVAYVIVTGLLLYVIARRFVSKVGESEAQLRLWARALEASANGIVIADALRPDLPIVFVNPAFERITGYRLDEVAGRNCRFLQGADRDQPALRDLRAALREGREGRAVLRNYRKDGSQFWNELYIAPVRDKDKAITHFVGVQLDVTQRQRTEAELIYRATHDTLTKLGNRTLLYDRVAQSIEHAKQSHVRTAVLLLDLDNFKVINDSLGHMDGDALLKVVANRIRAALAQEETAARIGGDEFAIVLFGENAEARAAHLSAQLLSSVGEPIALGERHCHVTCSIGVALYPGSGEKATELLEAADLAMYAAKAAGKNRSHIYHRTLRESVKTRLTLESELREALDRNELELLYQPQLDLRNDRIIGFEALLRWNHPTLGRISPVQFIPIAEETGLIVPIGLWVLRSVAAIVNAWKREAGFNGTIAVNVSSVQFSRTDFATDLKKVLEVVGTHPRHLEIELTESTVMDSPERFIAATAALAEMGVKVSIDDFGTGYSSLSYLKRFSIHKLKIDISFIRDIHVSEHSRRISQAVIAMSKALGLLTVAEGVESDLQAHVLRTLGCDAIQGYIVSRPVEAQAAMKMLFEPRADKTA
jgi:diguanylate cyclase (GGDEF)-like protein/PAS domain S-box-containing protein